MEVTGFPTSCDIYLELDGRKVAVVQSYTAKATKTSQVVEAFGESEPVATINGQNKYVLELTRLYATDDGHLQRLPVERHSGGGQGGLHGGGEGDRGGRQQD